MVGGDHVGGSGQGGHPLPTTHSRDGPVCTGPISKSESGQEGADHRSNCGVSSRMQWSSRQTQFLPPSPSMQTLIPIFSAVSGHETRIRGHATSVATPTADPSLGGITVAPAANQRAAASRRATAPGVAWGKSYLVLSIIAVLASPTAHSSSRRPRPPRRQDRSMGLPTAHLNRRI